MFAAKTRELKLGHGMEPTTTFGAVTTPAGLEKAQSQVRDALQLGAQLAAGSGKPFDGQFMEPVVLTGMT